MDGGRDNGGECGQRLNARFRNAGNQLIGEGQVFGWGRKREKPRVFQGTLGVVPRNELKQYFERWGMIEYESLETALITTLQDVFALPPAGAVAEPLSTDLGLDVFVSAFQSGGSLMRFLIPIIWRPKVTVTCRLYDLRTEQNRWTGRATRRMPWREFYGRLPRRWLTLRMPALTADDLNGLLREASHLLLMRLAKSI